MVFTGEALRRILLKQERSVSIFDKRGRFEGSVPPSVAVELARKGKLFGIGRAKAGEVWGLRVSGDSMINAHILDGDLAILARREPRPGDIIAALVDETTTTLKRLVLVRGRPVLRAENKRYRDIVPERRLESQGVMVGLIRRKPD